MYLKRAQKGSSAVREGNEGGKGRGEEYQLKHRNPQGEKRNTSQWPTWNVKKGEKWKPG